MPPWVVPAIGAGVVIGFILGLLGAGGSIVAVPLLVYVVGVGDTHAAIGTAAVAVSLSALMGLAGHARSGTVQWGCAIAFAAAGVPGAALGAQLGRHTNPDLLLALFGLLMIAVGMVMLRRRPAARGHDFQVSRADVAPLLVRLLPLGMATGLLAGFFGIGGGFLIVPALMLATGMPVASAIGTSLAVVFALGATTAASYAADGRVDWGLTALMAIGGALGTVAGVRSGRALAKAKNLLAKLFAFAVIATGLYVVGRGWQALSLWASGG